MQNVGLNLINETIFVGTRYTAPPRLHLLYHEVRAVQSRYSYDIGASAFESHVDLVAKTQRKQTPDITAEFTFDDGHASDFELVLPILSARGLRAQFFVTVGWTGCKPGYMGWQEVRSLHDAGHIVGAHGWSHALLTHCSPQELEVELRKARTVLEDKLGAPVSTMSLPGGRYDRRVLLACRESGYAKVYTSVPRLELAASEFTVGRVNMKSHVTADWITRLLQPGSSELAQLHTRHQIRKAAKRVVGDWLYEKLWAATVRKEPDDHTGAASSR